MGPQPNVASRTEVVSIYKSPPKKKLVGALPQICGAKNIKFWPLFRDFRTRHRIFPEQNFASTNKNASVSLCVP